MTDRHTTTTTPRWRQTDLKTTKTGAELDLPLQQDECSSKGVSYHKTNANRQLRR